MEKNDFKRILQVTQDLLDFVYQFPNGVTMREFKRHAKALLSHYGLEVGAYVYYDNMALEILEAANAIKLVCEPRYPTRIIANTKEDNE